MTEALVWRDTQRRIHTGDSPPEPLVDTGLGKRRFVRVRDGRIEVATQ